MTSSDRRPLGAAVLLAALLVHGLAHAEPSAADLETARSLYREGKALRAQGDLAGAVAKLRAAHALGRTPITGLELARAYALEGHLLEARETALDVARIPVASDETQRSAVAREEAARFEADLAARLATVVVHVTGGAPGDDVRVVIDGEPVPAAAVGEPRRADPGRHVVVATFATGEATATIELHEGESRDVELAAPPAAATPAAPAAPSTVGAPAAAPAEPPITSSSPASAPRARPLLWIGGGAFVSGVVVGSIFGVQALAAKSQLARDCPDGACGPASHGELESARSAGTVSTIAFGVAAVGGAVALYDLLTHRSSAAMRGGLAPTVGAGWVGAHGTF